ncbi:MAG: hypothetical protein KJ906_03890 [Nanoarchaeota archaeon]|nr:hypothetical protein [Nanoarchaeota archaeon]
MKQKILIASGVLIVLLGAGIGTAVFTSYGQITGYTTVDQALTLDIMGSSNDINYTINVKQGEIGYSPRIKLVNSGSSAIPVNFTNNIISGGTSNDVTMVMVNEGKNITLDNPVTVPAEDAYVYIKYDFDPAANVGNYVFELNAIPV